MTERRGRLLLPGGQWAHGIVHLGDGLVREVERLPGEPPAAAPVVAPGLIDLHIHGFRGHDPLEDPQGMARELARVGTTAFLPTLFPAAPETLGRQARELWSRRPTSDPTGASLLGLHLEGPFVNPAMAGALPPDQLGDPSPTALRSILGSATGTGQGIRIMTVAPELPGAPDLIAELVRSGVRVSLGHSRAEVRDALAAARAGARGVTHLFNAMGPLHHRRAGLLGFALSDDALSAEIIADLTHVGPEAFRLALRARGKQGLCLVSDALRMAGTGCDVFESGGARCGPHDGAFWRLGPDGEPLGLAGASASQLEGVRRLVQGQVASLEEALTMASESPARSLGLEGERGRIVPGARADLILLDPGDLRLVEVLVGGEPVPLPSPPSAPRPSGR